MDFKTPIYVNGVAVSLLGHSHSAVTNTGTGSLDMTISNVNDTYGPVIMHLQNRTGVNGVLFEQLGTVDLLDFGFKTLTQQSSLRLEARTASMINASNTTGEWQFGPAATPWLSFGSASSKINTPLLVTGALTGSSTVSGTNLDVHGYSTNIDSIKVYTSATQSISSSTNTKLVFGAVAHAPDATAWSAASNRYIANTAGYYSVTAAIRTTGVTRNNKLMLYKNGTLVQALCDYNTTALANPHLIGSTDISLAATDYLELWIYTSGSATIASSMDCNFCISRNQ